MTIFYSILHLLVDGICAFAMFGRFLPRGTAAVDLILYNFCAFALQMPFGVLLDYLEMKSATKSGFRTYSYYAAAAGVFCTILGTVTHPVLLGIGNALFHIGGGVGTIHEDNAKNWHGRGLGVFVAPGALGLYLGTAAAKNEIGNSIGGLVCIFMFLLCAAAAYRHKNHHSYEIRNIPAEYHKSQTGLALCCVLVVILRSYIGMTVKLSWNTTFFTGLCAVSAVVLGKMAGGFLAAKYGFRRTSVISLLIAAIAYVGSSTMPVGIAALLLFNMTMPVTLYLMILQFPQMPGFSFGLLTFGLFLGFLPEYFSLPILTERNIIGSVGSILSLLILLIGLYICKGNHND